MDARQPLLLRAGGGAPEWLEQCCLGALGLLGGQARPQLGSEEHPRGHAGGGCAGDGAVGQVRIAEHPLAEAASGHLARGDAVGQLALEAAAAGDEAAQVLVLRDEAQPDAVAKVKRGNLARGDLRPKPPALVGGAVSYQLYDALRLARREVDGEAIL